MNLTRESEYALRGLVRLGSYPPDSTVSLATIAKAERLPATFLAKIFQKLARHGVLDTERGRGSGYALRNPPKSTRIRDIFEAVEGPQALKRCLLWGANCDDATPCPLHTRLRPLHDQLNEVLSQLTLADFIDETVGESDSSANPEVRDV